MWITTTIIFGLLFLWAFYAIFRQNYKLVYLLDKMKIRALELHMRYVACEDIILGNLLEEHDTDDTRSDDMFLIITEKRDRYKGMRDAYIAIHVNLTEKMLGKKNVEDWQKILNNIFDAPDSMILLAVEKETILLEIEELLNKTHD